MNVVVYVADFETYEVLFVNAFTEKVFGAGWAGRRCYDYLQSGQTGPCAFCTNPMLVRDGEAQPAHVWEFQNTTDHRWYLCIDRAIPWLDGRLVRMETAVDITDRKEIERFREQYVGLVSHDLRGPLNAIMLAADGLGRSLVAKGLEREAGQVARIEQTASRVEGMIRDLLDSMRLEANAVSERRELVDIAALAQVVLDALAEKERSRVTLRATAPAGRVLADPTQLDRVIDNLVCNALKHSPPGSPVLVEIAQSDEDIVVSVVDQGAGIPTEHREKIFERFYRVPETRADGLGLGLYIARAIVERHGGRLGVESAPGHGSRFHVTLPVATPRCTH